MGGFFLGDDLDGREVLGDPGAGQLVSLFGLIALGHQDEPVAGGEAGEGFGHAGQELDFLVGDGGGEGGDALLFLVGDRPGAEALEAGDQGAGEAGDAVAVGEDGFALHGVEGLTHLGGGVGVVIQVADEGDDGAFKVDVVFPQSVVGIDEQGLTGRELGHDSYGSEQGLRGGGIRVRFGPDGSVMRSAGWRYF